MVISKSKRVNRTSMSSVLNSLRYPFSTVHDVVPLHNIDSKSLFSGAAGNTALVKPAPRRNRLLLVDSEFFNFNLK